jgi:hypothetical protein
MLILDTISIALIGLTGRIRRQGDWLQPAAAAVVTAAVVASLGGGAPTTFDGPGANRGVIHQQTARTISGGDGNRTSAPAYFAVAETTGGTYLEAGANSPDKATSPSGPSSTTIFEVDGVDDTPEQTTVQVLDTKVKTGEEGSPTPVCVSGSSIAPAPAACPSPGPRKR